MSDYYTILTSVQTQVATIVTNTVLRRKLFRLESDVFPIVYVTPDLPGGDKIRQQTMKKGVWHNYPVIVTYVQAGASNLLTGLDTFLQVREDIRDKLYQPSLSGATQVFDVEFDPQPVLNFAEFLGTDYDVCGWKFNYTVANVRSS